MKEEALNYLCLAIRKVVFELHEIHCSSGTEHRLHLQTKIEKKPDSSTEVNDVKKYKHISNIFPQR